MKYLQILILSLLLTTALFNCSKDFSSSVAYEDLSDVEKVWLEDSNNDGVPDSLAKYVDGCELEILKCVEIAQKRQKMQNPK